MAYAIILDRLHYLENFYHFIEQGFFCKYPWQGILRVYAMKKELTVGNKINSLGLLLRNRKLIKTLQKR